MRRFIAIIILIICAMILYLYSDKIFSGDNNKDDSNRISDGKQLLRELKDDYNEVVSSIIMLQSTPDQVIKFNNMIKKKLYSGNINEEEIELLLTLQRELYSEELLQKNPKDIHFKRGKEEIDEFKSKNIKIIGYDSLAPEFIGEEKNFAIIKVLLYLNITSDRGEIYEEYLLEKEGDKWYIKGWQNTEEFTILGE